MDKQTSAARALLEAYAAEVAEDPEMAADLIEGETGFFEALDSIIEAYQRDGELIEGITAREAMLKQRKQRLKGRQGRWKAIMQQGMAIVGLAKVQRPAATLGITRKAPQLEVVNEPKVPTEYFSRPDPKIDMAKLKASPYNVR